MYFHLWEKKKNICRYQAVAVGSAASGLQWHIEAQLSVCTTILCLRGPLCVSAMVFLSRTLSPAYLPYVFLHCNFVCVTIKRKCHTNGKHDKRLTKRAHIMQRKVYLPQGARFISWYLPSGKEWKPLPMDWRGSSLVDLRKRDFQSAKSFASPPQIVRTDWRGEPVLFPREFRVCRHWNVHVVGDVLSTMAHCSIVPWARHAKQARGFDHSRSVGISDRSVGDLRSTGWKFWKKLPDAASRFESFFSLSLERERIAGETAHRCRYTGASMFDRRQKVCESTARLDSLAKLSSRSDGVEGQIEPEIKRCGLTGIRVLMHKCISHMRPLSE